MAKKPEIKFVRSFSVNTVFKFRKSEKGRRHDSYQMFTPEFIILSFDDRGEIYIDHVHYVNLKEISSPDMKALQDQVIITFIYKDGFTYDFYVTSTPEEIRELRSPVINPRHAIDDEAAA